MGLWGCVLGILLVGGDPLKAVQIGVLLQELLGEVRYLQAGEGSLPHLPVSGIAKLEGRCLVQHYQCLE
jgi:hypothetical protein